MGRDEVIGKIPITRREWVDGRITAILVREPVEARPATSR
jgi:hypothetical protein